MDNRFDIDPKEFHVTMLELHTTGFIEFIDDENFILTDKGDDKARDILANLSISDRLLVSLYICYMHDNFKNEGEEENSE